MSESASSIRCDPQILGGTPVFAGTRVPLQHLFAFLKGGGGVDQFLENFPTVSREHVVALLAEAEQRLLADAHPA